MGGVHLIGNASEARLRILTPEAVDFVADLHRAFEKRRRVLLARRKEIQKRIDAGIMPDFLPETEYVRNGNWKIWPVPEELRKNGVEITGPASNAKMVINALNSRAEVYMADAEDAESPTFDNIVRGQANLYDAIRGSLTYETAEKKYQLNDNTAVLMFRPRGLHLSEKHVLVDGEPVSASLFDFGLYFYHNAKLLLDKGTAPYFYLPKLENHLEARFWNDVFNWAEDKFHMLWGTVKATVLIETVLAAFEMEEILYELKAHAIGLNCGRWDYIFSFIKKFRNHPKFSLPERSQLTMDKEFLASYANLLSKICHKRGALPIGGMSAYIPVKNNSAANNLAMIKVQADKAVEKKKRMVRAWVAHPGLVETVREVMNLEVAEEDQLDLDKVLVTASDLLQIPSGKVTESGLRTNIRVCLEYIESWLRGVGCVPINSLMEDAATAEISRAQLWQWIRHQILLEDGRGITAELVRDILEEELGKLADPKLAWSKHDLAAMILDKLITDETFEEFLTLSAYEHLLQIERKEVEGV